MAKTATKGIAGFLLAVVFVLGTLWWFPDAASATELPPAGPITEIPAVPSQTAAVKSVTGSPLGDEMLVNIWRAMLGKNATGTVVVPDPPPVKPITSPAAFTRGVGATAGSAILGGSYLAGWGIGTGGLTLYGAATGTDFNASMCTLAAGSDSGSFVVALHTQLNFGIGPSCVAPIPPAQANADQIISTAVVYGGVTIATYAGIGQYGYRCYWVKTGEPSSNRTLSAYNTSTGQSWHLQAGGSYCSAAPTGYYSAWAPASPPIYYRSGSTLLSQSTDSKPNPNRTPKCKITWPDATTTTGTGTAYNEEAGLPMSATGLGCKTAWDAKPGAGVSTFPSKIAVESQQDGGAITQISEQNVPSFGPDQKTGLVAGNGHGLVLERVINGIPKSCNTWDADCAGWWTATSSGTSPTVGTDTYRCTFGGTQIALTECGPYRNTFESATQAPTITDPATGESVPWSAGAPGWSTITPTVTGGGACGAAWSWNPVDWVLNPIKCAFVPSTTAVQAATTTMSTAWADTWPGQGMAAASTVLAVVPSASGCAGPRVQWTIDWPAHVVFDAEPLNACDAPVSTLATMARVIGALLLIGYTAWGITRRVGAVFNAPGVGPR